MPTAKSSLASVIWLNYPVTMENHRNQPGEIRQGGAGCCEGGDKSTLATQEPETR